MQQAAQSFAELQPQNGTVTAPAASAYTDTAAGTGSAPPPARRRTAAASLRRDRNSTAAVGTASYPTCRRRPPQPAARSRVSGGYRESRRRPERGPDSPAQGP